MSKSTRSPSGVNHGTPPPSPAPCCAKCNSFDTHRIREAEPYPVFRCYGCSRMFAVAPPKPGPVSAEQLKDAVRAYCDAHLPDWRRAGVHLPVVSARVGDIEDFNEECLLVLPLAPRGEPCHVVVEGGAP